MAEKEPAADPTEDTGDIEIGPDGSAVRRSEGGFSFHFTFDLPKLPKLNAREDWSHQALINGGIIAALALVLLYLAFDRFTGGSSTAAPAREAEVTSASPLSPNAVSDYNPNVDTPVAVGAYVDPTARVAGDVEISEGVYVGRFAAISSDAGQPMHIGTNSNIQDLATIGARPTFVYGKLDPAAFAQVPGEREEFAIYIGSEVSIASQAQVFGPAYVGNGTYIGMQALVADATIGAGVVIEPGAIVMGVTIPDGRYVAAGEVITTQHAADALPAISETYAFRRLGRDTVELYLSLAVSLGATAGTVQAGDGAHAPASSTSGTDTSHAAPAATDSHSADADGTATDAGAHDAAPADSHASASDSHD